MEITLRSGDSIAFISNLFQVPLHLINDSNENTGNTNKRGKINIPGYIAVPYVIKDGNTLRDLASKKNMDVEALNIMNPNKDKNGLQPGDTVFIPERIIQPFSTAKKACDYQGLVKWMNILKRVYPFISINTIGKSVLGNSIHEIRVGRGTKKIHMNASFHANEWITTMVLMSLVNHYLLSLTNGHQLRGEKAAQIYEEVELSVVPMVNPDGVDLVLHGPPSPVKKDVVEINEGSDDFIHWKANIRGVDLNNQFPAKWELCKENKKLTAPAPRDFPGFSPLTEPEAIAMAELAKNHSFDCVLAFHTQGEEFYWGYEGYEPAISEELAKEFERVSGYQAIRYVNSHAGYKDWFIQEFKRPGFTLELGKGINPLPLSQFDQILQRAENIFIAALLS